jgi:hypothetical protein
MSRHRSFVAATLATLAPGFLAVAHAQSTGLVPVNGPIQYATYDLATGSVQILPQSPSGGPKALAACFDNSCFSGFTSFGFAAEEFVDWGVKSCGTTEIIGAFDFGYAHGGTATSLTLEVAFYSGTTGFGVLGTEIARFVLSGLPGDVGAGTEAWVITVPLPAGGEICVPDGAIGWGVCFPDAVTGPLLIDVSVCGPSTGIIDVFDDYTCPATAGGFIGSFFFGGGALDFSSEWMTLYEEDGSALASAVPFNGNGVNPALYSNMSGPTINGTWDSLVDMITLPGSVLSIVAVSSTQIGPVPTAFGELLIDLSPASEVLPASGGAGAHSYVVPKDLSLIGFVAQAQAAVKHAGGLSLLNGLTITAGF